MNAYYNRSFGKKSNVFVKRSSIRGTAFSRPQASRYSIGLVAETVNFVDFVVDLFCDARSRLL